MSAEGSGGLLEVVTMTWFEVLSLLEATQEGIVVGQLLVVAIGVGG